MWLFDWKISDRTIRGYAAEEIRNWLANIDKVGSIEYYHYGSKAKFPIESTIQMDQPTNEVLSFLDSHFTESIELSVEVQRKVFKSGRSEIILRGRSLSGEITKLAVLKLKKK